MSETRGQGGPPCPERTGRGCEYAGARLKASSAQFNSLGFVLWAVGSCGRLGAEEELCQIGALESIV